MRLAGWAAWGMWRSAPPSPHSPSSCVCGGGRRLQVKVAAKSMTLGVPELISSASLGLYSSSPNLPGREGYFLIWK